MGHPACAGQLPKEASHRRWGSIAVEGGAPKGLSQRSQLAVAGGWQGGWLAGWLADWVDGWWGGWLVELALLNGLLACFLKPYILRGCTSEGSAFRG
eukprot:2256105-Alexandrium_andersonii.AAC.1